ncbi:dehydrogenase [Synergistales bacterium]|nr:dehydrogenase [Synergistales bacterium]
MKKIRVGVVGAGFAANVHLNSLARVHGLEVEVVSVCSKNPESSKAFAQANGIPKFGTDYKELLADPEIDVIDICSPAALHHTMVIEAAEAGKHIICEKPFTGYFGGEGASLPVGSADRQKMYDVVNERLSDVRGAIDKSGALFMYAENWIYSPDILKAASILDATKDKILFQKAEHGHSGSHAWHAAEWSRTGGGTVIRQGIHPISAVIWLKMRSALNRGEQFGIESVTAEVGSVCNSLSTHERRFIAARPVDVEDWGMVTINFTDGTHATILAGDFITGGVRSVLELNTNTGSIVCNMTPNDGMMTYFASDEALKDVYLTEKVENKAGWQFVTVEEEIMRGYIHEMQDFMECAAHGRAPLSGLDIACEATRVVYAAYLSAERGERVKY